MKQTHEEHLSELLYIVDDLNNLLIMDYIGRENGAYRHDERKSIQETSVEWLAPFYSLCVLGKNIHV
jgi:hypothetical protein